MRQDASLHSEEGGSIVLRNVIILHHYMMSHTHPEDRGVTVTRQVIILHHYMVSHFTLKIQEHCSPETLVSYRNSTWRHTSESRNKLLVRDQALLHDTISGWR